MELRELKSLLALSEQGSITGAADRLHLSAAAIHKHLKLLEDELGVRLYEKVGRQLLLTQAAQTLLPHVRNLLAEYEAGLTAIEEWKGLRRGQLRIGSGQTFSSYILPSLIEAFRRRAPEVELFVETGHTPQLLDELNKGALDLCFIVPSDLLMAEEYSIEAQWTFEIVLVSKEKQFTRPCRLADLNDQPFILYRSGSIFEKLTDRYFSERGFRPRIIMRFDNPEAIKAMIRSGLGISMLPIWTIEEELKNNRLSLIRQRETPLRGKIALVTRRPGYLSQPVRAFIEIASGWKWKNLRQE